MESEEREMERQWFKDWQRRGDAVKPESEETAPAELVKSWHVAKLRRRRAGIVRGVEGDTVFLIPDNRLYGTQILRKGKTVPLKEFCGYRPMGGEDVFYYRADDGTGFHLAVETGALIRSEDSWSLEIPCEVREEYERVFRRAQATTHNDQNIKLYGNWRSGWKFVSDITVPVSPEDGVYREEARFFFFDAQNLCIVSPFFMRLRVWPGNYLVPYECGIFSWR
ncbi:MAG: hypothetical protein II837_11135 [Treponema sp.]|nr:hypothetical protein [Treponema sp.]